MNQKKKKKKKKNAIFGLVSAKIDRQGIIQFFDTILDEFIIKLGSNIDDTTMRIEDRGTDNKKCC